MFDKIKAQTLWYYRIRSSTIHVNYVSTNGKILMWLQFEIWSNISYNTNVLNSLSPFITLIFHGKHYPTLSTLCTGTAASTRQSLVPSLNPVIGQKSWYSPVIGPLWDVHPPHGSNYVNFIWTDIYAFLYHHWSCDQMWYIYSYIHTINLTAMNKSESVIKRHFFGLW